MQNSEHLYLVHQVHRSGEILDAKRRTRDEKLHLDLMALRDQRDRRCVADEPQNLDVLRLGLPGDYLAHLAHLVWTCQVASVVPMDEMVDAECLGLRMDYFPGERNRHLDEAKHSLPRLVKRTDCFLAEAGVPIEEPMSEKLQARRQ